MKKISIAFGLQEISYTAIVTKCLNKHVEFIVSNISPELNLPGYVLLALEEGGLRYRIDANSLQISEGVAAAIWDACESTVLAYQLLIPWSNRHI